MDPVATPRMGKRLSASLPRWSAADNALILLEFRAARRITAFAASRARIPPQGVSQTIAKRAKDPSPQRSVAKRRWLRQHNPADVLPVALPHLMLSHCQTPICEFLT